MEMDYYLPISGNTQKQEPTEDTGTPIEEPQIRQTDAYSITASEQTPLSDPPLLPDHLFTETQRTLLELQDQGLNDSQIANKMDIKPTTLTTYKSQVEAIRKKFYEEAEGISQQMPSSPEVLQDVLSQNSDLSRLAPHEKEIADLIAQGLNAEQIADTLGKKQSYIHGCLHRIIAIQTGRLSDTEIQAYHLLSRGFTNNEIARELLISPKYVKTLSSSVQKKLGVAEREDLYADEAYDRLSPQYISVNLSRTPSSESGELQPEKRFLTEREYEVANIVVGEGLTNAEIAGRLNIEERTVAGHMKSIYDKMLLYKDELTREALEFFKPHTIYEQEIEEATSEAKASTMTKSERAKLLPTGDYSAIVPLNPQQVLSPTEIHALEQLADKPEFAILTDETRSGMTPVEISNFEERKRVAFQNLITNEALARKLNISRGNSANYIHSILSKLNVSTREEAVQVFLFYKEQGLL